MRYLWDHIFSRFTSNVVEREYKTYIKPFLAFLTSLEDQVITFNSSKSYPRVAKT